MGVFGMMFQKSPGMVGKMKITLFKLLLFLKDAFEALCHIYDDLSLHHVHPSLPLIITQKV